MPRKPKENAVPGPEKNRGKPRKYGPGKAGLCRHVGISMPGSLIDRLDSAADSAGVKRSALVVSLLESGLRKQCGG